MRTTARAVLCLVLMTLAHGAQADTFEGTLYDADLQPLAGIRVDATDAGVDAGSTTTNASGYYVFGIPGTGITRCVIPAVTPGYRWESTFAPYPSMTAWCSSSSSNISLRRVKNGVMGIRVQGGANGYVEPEKGESAVITISSEESEDGVNDNKAFILPPGHLVVKILDRRGREIAAIEREVGGGAVQASVTWNGRDRNGQPVPTGIYYAVATGIGPRLVAKIAVVRR